MTIQQIEYFLLVAEYKSFTKAAEKAYVSQPAISKQITLLEKEIGIVLFDRRYRSATLTPPGRILCEMLLRHKQEFEDVCKLASIQFSNWRNTIWIGLPENCYLGNMYELFGKFKNEHPDVSMYIDAGAGKELAVRVNGEDYDLIVTPRLMSAERARVHTEVIYRGKYVMLISKKHPLYGKDLDHSKLNGVPLFISAPKEVAGEILDIMRRTAYDMNDVRVLPTVNSIISAVSSQLGVGIVNDLVSIPDSYDLDVIPVNTPFIMEIAWRQENDNPFLPVLCELIRKNINIEPVL